MQFFAIEDNTTHMCDRPYQATYYTAIFRDSAEKLAELLKNQLGEEMRPLVCSCFTTNTSDHSTSIDNKDNNNLNNNANIQDKRLGCHLFTLQEGFDKFPDFYKRKREALQHS